jgi:hypothetical protein
LRKQKLEGRFEKADLRKQKAYDIIINQKHIYKNEISGFVGI